MGFPTGKTDDVIELKSSVRRAAARGFTVDLALIHTTSTTCLAWIFQHCLYDHMHDYPAQWVPPHPQLARGRMSPAVELRAFGSAATASLLSDASSWKWLCRTWLLPAPTFRQFRRHHQTDPATPWKGSWPPHALALEHDVVPGGCDLGRVRRATAKWPNPSSPGVPCRLKPHLRARPEPFRPLAFATGDALACRRRVFQRSSSASNASPSNGIDSPDQPPIWRMAARPVYGLRLLPPGANTPRGRRSSITSVASTSQLT